MNIISQRFQALNEYRLRSSGNAEPADVNRAPTVVEYCPEELLPPIDQETEPGFEYWSRRAVQPLEIAGPGPNTHNIPAFRFGIDHVEIAGHVFGQLQVPTIDYLNELGDKLSPGGIRLSPASSFANAFDLLSRLMYKQYPVTAAEVSAQVIKDDVHSRLAEVALSSGIYIDNEKVSAYKNDPITTRLIEHDMVDHSGIVTMPMQEADNVSGVCTMASMAFMSAEIPGYKIKDLCGDLDRLFENYSHYAYCNHLNPGTADIVIIDELRERMVRNIADINRSFAPYFSYSLRFNFDRINDRIAQFQRLPV